MKKKAISAVLSALLLATAVCPASATELPMEIYAAQAQTVQARANRIQIMVQDTSTYSVPVDGKSIPHLSYNGTTYVSIHAIAQWAGKQAVWDSTTKTVTASGTAERSIVNGGEAKPADAAIRKQTAKNGTAYELLFVSATTIDAQVRENDKVEAVAVLEYQNMQYLPVRTVAKLAGLEVGYKNLGDNFDLITLSLPVTSAENQQLKSYHTSADPLAQKIVSLYREIGSKDMINSGDKTAAKTKAQDLLNAISSLEKLQQPNVAKCTEEFTSLNNALKDVRTCTQNYLNALNSGKSLSDAAKLATQKNSKYLDIELSVDMIGLKADGVY